MRANENGTKIDKTGVYPAWRIHGGGSIVQKGEYETLCQSPADLIIIIIIVTKLFPNGGNSSTEQLKKIKCGVQRNALEAGTPITRNSIRMVSPRDGDAAPAGPGLPTALCPSHLKTK